MGETASVPEYCSRCSERLWGTRLHINGFVVHPHCLSPNEAATRITELEEENKRLREALRPFAEGCDTFADLPPDMQPDDDMCVGDALWDGEQPTIGDLRRAREAMTDSPPPDPMLAS